MLGQPIGTRTARSQGTTGALRAEAEGRSLGALPKAGRDSRWGHHLRLSSPQRGAFLLGQPIGSRESLLLRQVLRGLMDGELLDERTAIKLVQSRYGAKGRQLRFYKLAPRDFALCKIASAKSSGPSKQNACCPPDLGPRLCTICLGPASGEPSPRARSQENRPNARQRRVI